MSSNHVFELAHDSRRAISNDGKEEIRKGTEYRGYYRENSIQSLLEVEAAKKEHLPTTPRHREVVEKLGCQVLESSGWCITTKRYHCGFWKISNLTGRQFGFFRRRGIAWHEWDCAILATLGRLRDLGRPVCIGVSRKSFVGEIAGEPDPGRRLPGSLAAVTAAVLGGASLIRAHDVGETVQAVRVAESIRQRLEGD